jgi:SAM-dependent methyltransferase
MNGKRAGSIALIALVLGAAAAVARRIGGHAAGHQVPGGMLISDTRAYDRHTRFLFASLLRGIASNVAAATPTGSRVLDVGCGPAHLSIRMAGDHHIDVTGLDLDPAMVARARANAAASSVHGPQPSFVVGDVAALPFEDASFDFVVSTFSMHHWSDPVAGLNEIARVLRPGGKALIWDLKRGVWWFHAHAPDPVGQAQGSALQVVDVRPWRWPWRFALSERLELTRP